jgi:YidC/Oxa1 family membrane protein insertase
MIRRPNRTATSLEIAGGRKNRIAKEETPLESKNLIIAVVLSMAVIFVFGVLIPSFMQKGKKGEPRVESTSTKTSTEDGKTGAGAPQEKEAPPEKGAEETPAPAEGKSALPLYPEQKVTLRTPLVKAVFSTKGAALVSYELLDSHYDVDKKGSNQDLVTRDPADGSLLRQIGFLAESPGGRVPEDLDYRIEKETEDTVVFVSEVGPWRITRWYRMFNGYKISASTTVTNIGGAPASLRPAMVVRSYKEEKKATGIMAWLNPSRDIPTGLCNLAGKTERKDIKKLRGDKLTQAGEITFTAVDNLYFMSALIPVNPSRKGGGDAALAADHGASSGCVVSADDQGVIEARLTRAESNLGPGQSMTMGAISYIGPKEYTRLSDFGYELRTAINFGWFGALAIFFLAVLKVLHGWVLNWGLAIILLTIIIKVVLMPLTHWSSVSMRNMTAVKPLIDEINRRYKAPEDREKKNQAMMELYKAHKINPAMGCLPMLLQMPIWIALYSMLARSVELYHTPFFLWIGDLSQRDPYFVLPILLGGSMFLQQKMMPTTTDSQQAKMMQYFMPVMFTGFMLFLPAGLNLYILVSTVLTIVQQQIMYKPKVATAPDKKVQLLAEIDQRELKKDKARKK